MKNCLEDVLAEKWPLTHVKIGQKEEGGQGGQVFPIWSDQGAFVLKLQKSSSDYERAQRGVAALQYLREHQFPAPGLLPMRNGFYLGEWNGCPVYVMRFVEGRAMEETEAEEFELGRTAASLHKIGIDRYPCRASFVTRAALLSRFEQAFFKPEYDRLIRTLPDFTEDRQVLVHSDLCPENVIVTPEGRYVLIDFDGAGIGARSLELGYPLIMQFIDYEGRLPRHLPKPDARLFFRTETAKAFFQGYFAGEVLSAREKRLLFDGAITRMLDDLACLPEEALPSRWNQLLYALENRERLLRVLP